jgi:ABC-type iron transport system FetAB permease component
VGIITIPGMMTGAILGGSSVHQAAMLQMIIMFMITANIVLASVFITFITIIMVVDQEHRIRSDRIDDKKPSYIGY